MKLRLPHKFQAALVAALASVSFTTLSSGTIAVATGAALLAGQQAAAAETYILEGETTTLDLTAEQAAHAELQNVVLNADAGSVIVTSDGNNTLTSITKQENSALTLDVAGTLAISGTITGTGGSIIKEGTGTLTLSGNSSTSLVDTITVNAGTLVAAANGSLGSQSRTVSVEQNGTLVLQVHGTNDNGAGMPTISGSGTVKITDGNFQYHTATYMDGVTGKVLIADGGKVHTGNKGSKFNSGALLEVASGGTLMGWGATFSKALTLSGGTLMTDGANQTYSGAITLKEGTTSKASPAGNKILTLSGVVSGAGAINIDGAGTVKLTGNNTYTGGTTVTSATLEIGSASALGSGAVNLVGGTLNINSNNAITLSSTITGAGSIAKNGTGALTLSGNNSGYTGTLTLNNGSLTLSSANALSNGTVVVGASRTLTVSSNNVAMGTVTLQQGSTLNTTNNNKADMTGIAIGTLNVNGNASITKKDTYSTQMTVGQLNGTGDLLVDFGTDNNANASKLVLSGAGNYSGVLTFSSDYKHGNNWWGRTDSQNLQIDSENALAHGVLNLLGYSGTYTQGHTSYNALAGAALNSSVVNLAGLKGNQYGIVYSGAAAGRTQSTAPTGDGQDRTLYITTAQDAGHDYAGKIGAHVNLVVDGSGTQTLSGDLGSFTGSIEVKGGKLTLAPTTSLATHAVNVASGAELAITIVENNVINLNSSIVNNGTMSLTGEIALTGVVGTDYALAEKGAETYSGAGDYAGNGYLTTESKYYLVNNSGGGTLNHNVTFSDPSVQYSSLSDGSLVFSNSTQGTVYFVNSQNLAWGDAMGDDRTTKVEVTEQASLVLSTLSTKTIEGTGTVKIVAGDGQSYDYQNQQFLTSFGGTVEVVNGTMLLNQANTLGTGTVTVDQGAAILLTNNNMSTIGTLNVQGDGDLRLVTGKTDGGHGLRTVSANNLKLRDNGSHNGRFMYENGSDLTGVNHLYFDGAQLWINGKNFEFTKAVTFNGSTFTGDGGNLSNAAIRQGNSNTVFSGAVEIAANTRLTWDADTAKTSDINFAGTVRGGGDLELLHFRQSGTFTISGDASEYAGKITSDSSITLRVTDSGKLHLAGGSNLQGSVRVDGDLSMDGNGSSISGAVTGSGKLAKTGTGTTQVSGSMASYTGSVDVAEGTLNVLNATNLSVKDITIGAGSSMGVYSNTEVAEANEGKVTMAANTTLKAGAGATLIANLEMKAGSTLTVVDAWQTGLTMGSDVYLNTGNLLGEGDLTTLGTLGFGEYYYLFNSVDNLYINNAQVGKLDFEDWQHFNMDANQVFTNLTPQTYALVYNWDNGANVGSVALTLLPEPTTGTLSLLALAALAARRRKK